jgi:hypothetical protein
MLSSYNFVVYLQHDQVVPPPGGGPPCLDEAASLGLRIKDTPGSHGHSWGYIDCTNADCAAQPRRYYVNSTPQSPGNEANKIRRFIRQHEHKEE